MTTPRESSDEEDAEEKVMEKEIRELRSAKKELFERTRPVNELLERIAQRERENVDKLHRLRAENHDQEKHKQAIERLTEVESELKRAKSENVKLSDTNNKLKRSLDQAAKSSKIQKIKIGELESRVTAAKREIHTTNAAVQSQSEIDDNSTVDELQKQLSETREQLNKATEELSGTRQRLSDVQERLTLAEQVRAATQQRELQESGNSHDFQLDLTLEHQSTAHAGGLRLSFFVTV